MIGEVGHALTQHATSRRPVALAVQLLSTRQTALRCLTGTRGPHLPQIRWSIGFAVDLGTQISIGGVINARASTRSVRRSTICT